MALYKQLLTERSAQISGKEIKEKALKVLQMKQPAKDNKQSKKDEWEDIVL